MQVYAPSVSKKMKFTCCACGSPADENFEVDDTGRVACSKKCEDALLGRRLPKEKQRGWYCDNKAHGGRK